MPLAFRASLCLLALSLSLINPASAQLQSLASISRSPQSSDEETLRRMTEQYGLALAAGDLEKLRQFWNPQSPNLAARRRYYKDLFSESRIELISSKVTRLEITSDKAVSRLTTDERRLDKKTGAVSLTYDPLRGACRSFEWVKADGGWRLEREFLVQDELAARLNAMASEKERDELLVSESVLVTNVLVLALSSRGIRLNERGDTDAALRCFQLQQAVSEKIGDRVGNAGAWMNMAIVKISQHEYENGLPVAYKALALYEAAGSKHGMALTLEKLSKLYRGLGDYRRAFDCVQKSLRLFEAENHRRGTALTLSEVAIIYGNQNNPEQALAHLERGLAIAQDIGDTIMTATLRHNMAVEYHRLGDYKRALEIYQGLLKQTEGFGDRVGAAMTRDQIGSVLAAQGRYGEALDYHSQALAALEAAKEPSVAATLNNMSGVYLAQGKYAEALALAERAVSLSRQTLHQLELWGGLTTLGYSHLGLNHPSEARQAFDEAVLIIEKLRTQTAGGVEEQVRYFENRLNAHHGMLSLLVRENQIREALVFAERAKARALLDVLQHGRIGLQKAMTVEEQEKEHRLKAELIRLNTQADVPGPQQAGERKSRLEKARLNYEAFQDSLYTLHPELKVQRGEAPVINAAELTALLPDATSALLEYVVTDDKIYLFAVTKVAEKAETEVRVYTLPIKRDDLARQIEAFRLQLASRDLGFRASAIKLYDLLLKPAAPQLRGKTNLILAPDDTLWDLPFQALLTGANRFLIEDAAIAYTPSLTALREMMKRRKQQNANSSSTTLLAMGNPQLGNESVHRAVLTRRDEKLDALPEAEQEVKALRQLYGVSQSKIYIGAEAREDRVKREAGQARILHFATHGMLNNASPMYSHLVLAQGDAGEDGLLEAWELMQLDLKADLAVLSACETARGRIGAGEGMIGLSWAMFIAGVPATVVSQWKVESAGTRDLMVNFHRGLLSQPAAGKAKPTKTEALRQAALKLMKNAESRHPFYWAGFVLIGDGR